jgi:hypothetical protein
MMAPAVTTLHILPTGSCPVRKTDSPGHSLRQPLPSGSAPRGSAGTVLDVALPAAFEGFYALHHRHYLAYALAHLDRHTAQGAVREVFGILATHWPHVVSRHSPASYAWQQLTASVHARTPPLPIPVETPEQYDAVVLHHIVGCELEEIAATTGQEPSKIRYLLRSWKHSAAQAPAPRTPTPWPA